MMRDYEEIVKRLFKILCEYKTQPDDLFEYLKQVMTGKYYPKREIIYERDHTVKDALFVSDGFVACYEYDSDGNRQVIGLYGRDSIVAGRSFTSQQPSEFDWVALPGAYLMKIGHRSMQEVYGNYPDSEELARMIMAGITEKEMKRLTLLKKDAESVVLDFYHTHPEFKSPGELLTDADLASYLLIGESTLRRMRHKLIANEKLKIAISDHLSGSGRI